MTALLQVKDVVAFYGDFQALFGVSFEVRPNEVLALIGGNGAGKTTSLRVISGLLRPRVGHGALRGEGHHPDPARRDRRFGHRPRARGDGSSSRR